MVGRTGVVVPIVVRRTFDLEDGSIGILPFDLRKDGLNVGDSGGLAVGELAGGVLVVIIVVLVLAIVVLVVVLVAGVVVADELEHADDDGAGLRTGHVLGAREGAVGHAGDDSEAVAGLDRSSVVAGNFGVVLDGLDGVGALVSSKALAVVDSDVAKGNCHLVAVHGVVVNGRKVLGHTYVVGNLLVGPIPGRSGGLGLGGSIQLVCVEGAGQHGDELDTGDLVFGPEGAVLEAGYDAELGTLGHIVVVPGGHFYVTELGDQGKVLVREDGVVSGNFDAVGLGLVVIVRGDVLSGLGVLPGAVIVEEDDVAVSGLVADGAVVVGVVDEERAVGDDPIVAGAAGISRERGDDQGEAHDQRHEQGENAGIELTHSVPSFHKCHILDC